MFNQSSSYGFWTKVCGLRVAGYLNLRSQGVGVKVYSLKGCRGLWDLIGRVQALKFSESVPPVSRLALDWFRSQSYQAQCVPVDLRLPGTQQFATRNPRDSQRRSSIRIF